MKRIIVGVTGASGSIYAKILIESLLKEGHEVYLVLTDMAEQVITYELKEDYKELLATWKEYYKEKLQVMDQNNFFEPIASGSFHVDAMVIIPASMGTIGKIRNCISDNLLVRAADVCIKEGKKLVLVPRESPLSPLHLENLYRLSQIGVLIVPPMPAFYQYPNTIEELVDQSVGRILDSMGIPNQLYRSWGENYEPND